MSSADNRTDTNEKKTSDVFCYIKYRHGVEDQQCMAFMNEMTFHNFKLALGEILSIEKRSVDEDFINCFNDYFLSAQDLSEVMINLRHDQLIEKYKGYQMVE